MDIKTYNTLPETAAEIRVEVFVDEQGFSKDLEFDEFENTATHVVGFLDGVAATTARYFYKEELKGYLIGRIAVRKIFRKKGLGGEIVKACEKEIIKQNATKTFIHAQLRVKEFYESLGYTAFGEIDLEEGVEHIWMTKSL